MITISINERRLHELGATLIRLLGWHATILHGDPTVVDRWYWLRRHLRTGPLRTLDAGCGSGAFTMYAAMQGNQAVGIANHDRDVAAAERRSLILGLSHIDVRNADLREIDRLGADLGTFDQVLLFECLEHILDDEALIANLAALLRPGGTILITTPYAEHRPLFGERVSAQEDGGHVRYGYTHDQVSAMLARNGLETVAAEYIGGLVAQKLASLQFALCRIHSHLAWAVTFPLRIFHPLDRLLTRLTGFPELSIGVVARKPG